MLLCCSRAPQAPEELHFRREQFPPCSSPSCSMDNCFLLFWVGLITSGAGRKQIWGLGYFLSLSTFCFIWGITAKGPNVQSVIWAGTEADNTGIWLECFYMAHHHITSHILDDFHPEEGLPCLKKGYSWVPIDGDFVSSLIEIILSLHTDKENYCISSPQRGRKKKKHNWGRVTQITHKA